MLTGIQLQFSNVPDPSVELTLSLYLGGNPATGVPLASELLLLTDADLDASWIFMWDLTSAGLSFDVDDVFTLQLEAAQSGYVVSGNDPPGYDGGSLFKNGAPAVELSDIAFITFMLSSP